MRWLLNANFVTLAAVLYICCFVNFDRIISRYNVEHSKEVSGNGVCLDIKYLEELGAESIPALVWFQQSSQNSCKAGEAEAAASRLIRDLNADWGNWRSRTLRKYALKKEVSHFDFKIAAGHWSTRQIVSTQTRSGSPVCPFCKAATRKAMRRWALASAATPRIIVPAGKRTEADAASFSVLVKKRLSCRSKSGNSRAGNGCVSRLVCLVRLRCFGTATISRCRFQ